MRTLALLLALAAPVLATGSLEIRGSAHQKAVVLRQHVVNGVIRDNVAEITVEQTFHSNWNSRLEGVYLFPLPDGATVSEFAMTVGGKMVKGEVLEKGKARRIYEGIVARKRDPGLLEQVDRNLFRARVFPIEPHQDLTIRVIYQQILTDNAGTLELRYPLSKDRLKANDVESVTLSFDIESSIDLKTVYCPSHPVEIERVGVRQASLNWTGKRDAQRRDFLLYVGRSPDDVGFSVLSHRRPAEEGSFLAVFAPAKRVESTRALPKDVVYVLDTSGSMEGQKIAQAKAALAFGIGKLNDGDRFNVISFSSGTHPFRSKLVAATTETRDAARQWLGGLEANGGTAIDEALRTALSQFASNRLGIVVFLTDGLPTVGENRPDQIVKNVAKSNPANARVFVFGVGFDQHVQFLDQITARTRGAREYITPEQNIEIVMSRFFVRIDQPVLTDLRVDWGEGVREVYPRTLPDLFAGDQLVVAGRYTQAGPRLVKLHGILRGRPVTYEYEGNLVENGGVGAVPRLWAKQKVEFLLEETRLRGETTEVKNEIVHLATTHSIVTPYTSGLVVEDEEVEDHSEVDFDEPAEIAIEEVPFTGPSTNSAIGLGGGRGGFRRMRVAGGSAMPHKNATDIGLDWLAKQECDNVLDKSHLLLAFLGAGYTDRGSSNENPHAKTVRDGLRYLMTNQNDQGLIGPDLKAHLVATTAMSEAYAFTRNPRYKKPAQEALYYAGRNIGNADTLTTAWAVIALKSGKFAGLEIDPDAFEVARQALVAPKTEVEAAATLFARVLLGEDPRQSAVLQALAARLHSKPPQSPKEVEYLYFGSLAMFQVGGRLWKDWNLSMKEAVIKTQLNQGDQRGSWGAGVADTAKLICCMEVYYRYDRIFARSR